MCLIISTSFLSLSSSLDFPFIILARIIHKFSTVAPKPSALTALPLARAPRRAVQHACGFLGRAPGQDGVFDASIQKPVHNPG